MEEKIAAAEKKKDTKVEQRQLQVLVKLQTQNSTNTGRDNQSGKEKKHADHRIWKIFFGEFGSNRKN